MATVLVVDNDPNVLRVVASILEAGQYVARTAATGAEAIAIYRAETIDLVLLDRRMPKMDGERTLASIRKFDPKVRCLLMSASTYADQGQIADIGASGQVDKPFKGTELLSEIAAILESKGQ